MEEHLEHIEENMVGRSWFRWVIGGIVSLVILGIGFIGYQQNWAFTQILTNQKEFSISINKVENTQIDLSNRMSSLEGEMGRMSQRQDVLRDQNMRMLEGRH